jgi:hypothetical protein
MGGNIQRSFGFLVVASLALPVLGQDRQCRATETAATNDQRCVSLPYTAQYKITRVTTQPDGAIISRESSEVRAADSAGRWMNATTQPEPRTQTTITRVVVADFVARTRSTWEVPGKLATVTAMGPKCSIARARPSKPPAELLGTQTIQGIEAKGRRVTWNLPEGKVRTSETWFAAAPGLWTLLVRAVYDSPASKATTALVNIGRSEPDPNIFRPPEGYEIVKKGAPPCPTE